MPAHAQHHEAVDGEGEDVIERQGCNDDILGRGVMLLSQEPSRGLLAVGDQVSVAEHGAFSDARGAAGILNDGGVVGFGLDARVGFARTDLHGTGERVGTG